MRWRWAAGAGLMLFAELLTQGGVVLAQEEEEPQRVLGGKPFKRPSGQQPVGANRRGKGGGGRRHGRDAVTAPAAVESGCPYAIETEEEATLRAENTSLSGNVVTVEHLEFCRTGNHFINVIRNLAVGYCCKSRVLWLPPKDEVLAPGIFSEGTPGPRWFDFSSAPDVPGFNSSSCSTDITWAGQRAFHMYQLELPDHEFYNPALLKCVARAPRLLGCEAAYYFPKDVDVCSASAAPTASDLEQEDRRLVQDERPEKREHRLIPGRGEHANNEEGGQESNRAERTGTEEDIHRKVQEDAASESKDGDDWENDGGEENGGDEGGQAAEEWWEENDRAGGDGTLVLHVRSGDIFDNEILAYYGQPPLQLYLRAIEHANWDRVEVVTNGQDEKNLNPVIAALREKVTAGELPSTIKFHTNRTMDEDLRSMFCADGLVLARSTLVSLTGYHSKAKRVYGPIQCNAQLNHLALYRPDDETYGVVWPGRYSIYFRWENTPHQLEEMLTYDKISGFSQCSGERAE